MRGVILLFVVVLLAVPLRAAKSCVKVSFGQDGNIKEKLQHDCSAGESLLDGTFVFEKVKDNACINFSISYMNYLTLKAQKRGGADISPSQLLNAKSKVKETKKSCKNSIYKHGDYFFTFKDNDLYQVFDATPLSSDLVCPNSPHQTEDLSDAKLEAIKKEVLNSYSKNNNINWRNKKSNELYREIKKKLEDELAQIKDLKKRRQKKKDIKSELRALSVKLYDVGLPLSEGQAKSTNSIAGALSKLNNIPPNYYCVYLLERYEGKGKYRAELFKLEKIRSIKKVIKLRAKTVSQ